MNPLDDFFHALRTGQIERVIAQIATIIALVASLGILPALGSSDGGGTTPSTTTPGAPTTPPTTSPNPNPPPLNSTRLVDLERVARNNMQSNVPVAINGRVYENSLAVFSSRSASVEYNLSREYSRLTATVGIDDNASVAQQYALVKFFVDGNLVREVRAELGNPREVSIPLDQGLRLRIETASYRPDNTSINTKGTVIGSPHVYR